MTKPKAPKKRVKAGTSRAEAEKKRLTFVEAFLANGGNASKAAIQAGYAVNSAGVTGAKMLKDPRVKQQISIRQHETLGKLALTTDRVLLESCRMAFSDVRGLYHPDGKVKLPTELDDDTAAAVQSFKIDEYGRVEYKLHDKNSPSERLFKHLNLYKDDNKDRAPRVQVALIQLVALTPANGITIDADS